MNGQPLHCGRNINIHIGISLVDKNNVEPASETSIFIANISPDIKKSEIFKSFVIFGGVSDVSLVPKKGLKNCTISFMSRESQIKALEQKTIKIQGQDYEIKRYKDKEVRSAEQRISLTNIPEDLNQRTIQEALSKTFGEVSNVWLNQQKNGYGTARFKNREDAKKASVAGKIRLNNNVIFIEPFSPLVVGRTLHLSNLPKLVSDEELRQFLDTLLGPEGGIATIVSKWPHTNVLFDTKSHAEKAYSVLKEKVFKGKRVQVEFHQKHFGRKQNGGTKNEKCIILRGIKNKISNKTIEVKCASMGKVVSVEYDKKRKCI
eukprot:UN30217